jgi:hypothetical protein
MSATYNSFVYNAIPYNSGANVDPVEAAISWADIVACLYPRLHATNEVTLVWWTESELRSWANQALQVLSREALLFVRRNTDIQTSPSQRLYSLPTRHVATIVVSCGSKLLRPTDSYLLDMLDYSATVAVCDVGESPKRWYEDATGGNKQIGIYPSPSAAVSVGLILLQQPEPLTSTASTIPVPQCIRAFVEDWVLGHAWASNTDFAMPELSNHLLQKQSMYLDVLRQYWGPNQ